MNMADNKEKNKEKKPIIPKKVFYEIVVETVVPIKVKYRVWAETPHQAAEMVKKGRVPVYTMPKIMVRLEKIKSLVVFLAGTVNKVFVGK